MRHQTPAVQAWREKDGSCAHCGEQLDPPPPVNPIAIPQDWWSKYGPTPPTAQEMLMAQHRSHVVDRYLEEKYRQLREQG